MRYRTVMKVNIFRLCTKDHTTVLFLAVLVIVEAKMAVGSFAGKTGHPQRFAMQFSSYS